MSEENIQYNQFYYDQIEIDDICEKDISRRKRRYQTRHKHKKLISTDSWIGYPSIVYWNGRYWKRVHSHGCNRGRRTRLLKKMSNRKVRYYKGKIGDGGKYRRCYDYWYLMW